MRVSEAHQALDVNAMQDPPVNWLALVPKPEGRRGGRAALQAVKGCLLPFLADFYLGRILVAVSTRAPLLAQALGADPRHCSWELG